MDIYFITWFNNRYSFYIFVAILFCLFGNFNYTFSFCFTDIQKLQQYAERVTVDDSIKNYIINIVTATRNPRELIDASLARYVEYGVSPRGGIALMKIAQAVALMEGRAYVTPDDVKRLRYAALRHRIILNFEAAADEVHPEAIIDAIFAKIQTP